MSYGALSSFTRRCKDIQILIQTLIQCSYFKRKSFLKKIFLEEKTCGEWLCLREIQRLDLVYLVHTQTHAHIVGIIK